MSYQYNIQTQVIISSKSQKDIINIIWFYDNLFLILIVFYDDYIDSIYYMKRVQKLTI